MITRTHPTIRFCRMINKDGPTHPILKTKCWEWIGAIRKCDGYGSFEGVTAHRKAMEIHLRVKLPFRSFVLHRCDNYKCVRPTHLFLGSQKMNMEDKADKGRCDPRHGELHALTKLTDKKVIKIRKMYKRGKSVNQLAVRFDVRYSVISKIIHNVTWRHLL